MTKYEKDVSYRHQNNPDCPRRRVRQKQSPTQNRKNMKPAHIIAALAAIGYLALIVGAFLSYAGEFEPSATEPEDQEPTETGV